MNLVYFVCHDLGHALACLGAGIPTPRLDAFSRESILFSNAHCASPACSPSRACAMSGLYPHRSGALGLSHMGWPLAAKWQTSVDDFNHAGYQTILSGINHERHPRSDRYETDLSRTWDDWKLPAVVDNALHALAQRDPNRPFYINLATQEPHACIWKDVGGRIPPLPDAPAREAWLPPGMPRTPALEAAFRRFAACVAFLDAEFGRFLDGLDALGLRQNTLVVFTTDHGMSGPRGKGSLLGLGTEIALLVRRPGNIGAGRRHASPVSNLDFRPTFAEACGVKLVSPCDGTSRWGEWTGEQAASDSPLFLERNFHGEKPWRTEPVYIDCLDPIRAVRTRTHLYIRNFSPKARPPEPGLDTIVPTTVKQWNDWEHSWELPNHPRPAEELYDLLEDPLETRNRIGDPAYAKVADALRSQLAEWMRTTGDFPPAPPPNKAEAPGWGPNWPA